MMHADADVSIIIDDDSKTDSVKPFYPDQVPGIYNISNDEYHNGAGLSSSGLKLLARSPLHYWHRYLRPDREPERQTPALVLGQQIHAAVLEPGKYFDSYYPLPRKFDRRTKFGKTEYEWHEQEAAKVGKTIIDAGDHMTCQRIAEAVHANDASAYLFDLPGPVEESLYWEEEVMIDGGEIISVLCKCRPDKRIPAHKAFLDLKSCEGADITSFERAVANWDYHVSAQFYRRGIRAVTGEDVEEIVFCAFEKDPPHAAAFYTPSVDMLAHADLYINGMLRIYAACKSTGEWPGYPAEIQMIHLPAWKAKGAT